MKLTGHYIILQKGFIPAGPVDFTRGDRLQTDKLTVPPPFVELPRRAADVQTAAPMRRVLSPRVAALYTYVDVNSRFISLQNLRSGVSIIFDKFEGKILRGVLIVKHNHKA